MLELYLHLSQSSAESYMFTFVDYPPYTNSALENYPLLWYFLSLNHFHLILASLLLCATVYRLELQHGFSIPVPQLEGVCGCVCPAVCVCCGGTYLHAWKSQILPWGKSVFLNYCSLHTENLSDLSSARCISGILNNTLTKCCVIPHLKNMSEKPSLFLS